jgi:putative FmdB family regulatory protein
VPLYEYKCVKCGRRFEKIENLNGPHLKKCPNCAAKVERMLSAPAIQFKGSGWYVTDYANRSKSADKKDSDGSGENAKQSEKPSEKPSEKSETKTDKRSAAPADKKEKKKSSPTKDK